MSETLPEQRSAGEARWAGVPPAERRRQVQPATAATYRRGINGLIGRLRERAEYLSDEQRAQLRALADSQAET